MNSRDSHSLAASRRSQSLICRCTAGSGSRRRSGRGGKSPPRTSRAGLLLSLMPLLPDQETVGQHHTHRVPVEPRPEPALILVPPQQFLGFLMVLLHPVPSVSVFHQTLQSGPGTEVAPEVAPLAVGGILTDQPAPPTMTRRGHPPAPQRHEAAPHPALAPFAPRHRPPRARRLRRDQVIGSTRGLVAADGSHGEVAPDRDHRALAACF